MNNQPIFVVVNFEKKKKEYLTYNGLYCTVLWIMHIEYWNIHFCSCIFSGCHSKMMMGLTIVENKHLNNVHTCCNCCCCTYTPVVVIILHILFLSVSFLPSRYTTYMSIEMNIFVLFCLNCYVLLIRIFYIESVKIKRYMSEITCRNTSHTYLRPSTYYLTLILNIYSCFE